MFTVIKVYLHLSSSVVYLLCIIFVFWLSMVHATTYVCNVIDNLLYSVINAFCSTKKKAKEVVKTNFLSWQRRVFGWVWILNLKTVELSAVRDRVRLW